MIVDILNLFFVLSVLIISVYLVRHYIFTITVLKYAKNSHSQNTQSHVKYEPTVSILIPAHNEDQVISVLLQKMNELSYPKSKLEVIVIDDASRDNTGQIADEYAKKYNFIKVLHRDNITGGKGKPAALNAALKQSKGGHYHLL